MRAACLLSARNCYNPLLATAVPKYKWAAALRRDELLTAFPPKPQALDVDYSVFRPANNAYYAALDSVGTAIVSLRASNNTVSSCDDLRDPLRVLSRSLHQLLKVLDDKCDILNQFLSSDGVFRGSTIWQAKKPGGIDVPWFDDRQLHFVCGEWTQLLFGPDSLLGVKIGPCANFKHFTGKRWHREFNVERIFCAGYVPKSVGKHMSTANCNTCATRDAGITYNSWFLDVKNCLGTDGAAKWEKLIDQVDDDRLHWRPILGLYPLSRSIGEAIGPLLGKAHGVVTRGNEMWGFANPFLEIVKGRVSSETFDNVNRLLEDDIFNPQWAILFDQEERGVPPAGRRRAAAARVADATTAAKNEDREARSRNARCPGKEDVSFIYSDIYGGKKKYFCCFKLAMAKKALHYSKNTKQFRRDLHKNYSFAKYPLLEVRDRETGRSKRLYVLDERSPTSERTILINKVKRLAPENEVTRSDTK